MSKMKKATRVLFSLMLTIITFMIGGGGVMMADATALPDAGTTTAGSGTESASAAGTNAEGTESKGDGIASDTANRAIGDEDFLDKEIDSKVIKIRPMSTPIDQISRYAKVSDSKQFDFKYFSVGTRPIKTTLKTAVTAQTSGSSVAIEVTDNEMFTYGDTIRVVGIKGSFHSDANGIVSAYDTTDGTAGIPDLELKVIGVDDATSNPTVYAVNGLKNTNGQPIFLPAIPANTVLIRMGKAGAELDVQTGRFTNIPTSEVQYCQQFMLQLEQTTWDKISAKLPDWGFSDIEEDGIYDMRMGMEGSFLFGSKGMIKHKADNGYATWFTGGIWWMAGKDITVGHWDATNKKAVISDDDLVDIAKDLFVGTGSGNKRKIMFCGSDMLAALSKITSDKFRLKDTVEVWNLKFKSWDTDFGEILTIHHEFLDLNGMSDCAFALDPEYLYKKKHISWSRSVLDLKKAGIRNTDAVVLSEASAVYLRYAKAHARMKLAAAS